MKTLAAVILLGLLVQTTPPNQPGAVQGVVFFYSQFLNEKR
jgi:hypothetical protein